MWECPRHWIYKIAAEMVPERSHCVDFNSSQGPIVVWWLFFCNEKKG